MNKGQLKITVLCENTVGAPLGLTGEWGLSLLVESAGARVLFDTGQEGSLLTNAVKLGVDLKSVEALVVSHGHYDHAGGMRDFLKFRGRLPVYVHREFFASHYGSLGEEPCYIGVPFCREELEDAGADFIFVRKYREISPGLWLSGEIPRKTDFEEGDKRLFQLDGAGKAIPDALWDDMSLYCRTPKGLVIILGCAHAGLVNIVEHAREVTGVEKIHGIIGGTHLGPVSDRQKDETISFLQGLDLGLLAPNHCTGLPMMARLAALFGPCFKFAPAGAGFTFD